MSTPSTTGHMTAPGSHVPVNTTRTPHPLDQLSVSEVLRARQTIISIFPRSINLIFRVITLREPPKHELSKFLEAEHAGKITSSTPRPARLADVQYDVYKGEEVPDYTESIVDVVTGKEVERRVVGKEKLASLMVTEFRTFPEICESSQLFKDAIAEFDIPEGFVITIDPWPYGGPDVGENVGRLTQGLVYARDTRNGGDDANHYAYPIPIIPVADTYAKKLIRIDRCATGGLSDPVIPSKPTHPKNILDHCKPANYYPELIDRPLRTDMKPLNVVQPEGPSFKVSDESLVEWQKWRFRVGFNHREGATLHDVRYEGRSVMYRMSISEMTVPYGDPRPPFHRKQAFDFGDGGGGRAANNLSLGCDCLGVIKYFDGVLIDPSGQPSISKNIICLHEQDNGIGWKHTNYRTERAVVTRLRELVVQFIITLANYEYLFAYKLDNAGNITFETRATGIVSVVSIDPGKTSPWGNVVSPGALAQNHQHIFSLRMDPAIDGPRNTVVVEESLPMPFSPETNPYGNGYEVRQTKIEKSCFFDANPATNLVVKMTNPNIVNAVSGRNVGYKFVPSASQLLLAHEDSVVAKRAQFARHHVWVTKYRDGELWAGGEFTNQSQRECDGVADAVQRGEGVENEDLVVWCTFGLTHNPRVEDWPVMPVEIHQIHLRPTDFFTSNPALDVPGNKNLSSALAPGSDSCCEKESGDVQQAATTHLQGAGPDIDPKTKEKSKL